jgi:hypothetical protein
MVPEIKQVPLRRKLDAAYERLEPDVVFEHQNSLVPGIQAALQYSKMAQKAPACADARKASCFIWPDSVERLELRWIRSDELCDLLERMPTAICPLREVDQVNPVELFPMNHYVDNGRLTAVSGLVGRTWNPRSSSR